MRTGWVGKRGQTVTGRAKTWVGHATWPGQALLPSRVLETRRRRLAAWAGVLACACAPLATADEPSADDAAAAQGRPYAPAVADDVPRAVYWGDTHVHTAISGDAFNGGTRLGLDDAYRFARGEEVLSSSGQRVRLRRPLDFIVVADHGNNAGAAYARDAYDNEPAFRQTELGRLWQSAFERLSEDAETDLEAARAGPLLPTHRPNQVSVRHEAFRASIWEMVTAAADRYNDPGTFTTFIGYEWTPLLGAVHRVVIFGDGAERANQVVPLTSYDTVHVEVLWDYLARYEERTGGRALAIPHNSNLTFGLMFSLANSWGRPLTAAYAQSRSRFEPVVEVTQIKGDSETHPYLSPDDAFADFETWNGWGGRTAGPDKPPEQVTYEYARSALKLGLSQRVNKGHNPFKFGMIGSSDAHTALAAVAEDNFWGKMGASEPHPGRVLDDATSRGWQASAAGSAAVWARENSRDAIFEALRRKEVYATTGPRIALRFFGGWSFEESDAARADLAVLGYRGGVTMGGDLTAGPPGAAPTFLMRALKDPDGANLDRIQVVKGWRTAGGELEERVHDVAWSGDRPRDGEGRLSPVGSTVDVDDASYLNTIGVAELSATWRDPDFRTGEHAFYYVRVLEIPTPRWTAYEAKFFGLEDVPEHIPMVTQERAYSSPIWYTPTQPE